jgi:phospholipid/cholesterol/gamma-HCH transport system permease protein
MTSTPDAAWYTLQPEGDTMRLAVGGAWTRGEARRLDPLMRSLSVHGYGRVEIDCRALSHLDTVGAWLLLRTGRKLEHNGATVRPVNVAAEYQALVHTINHECRGPPVELPPHHPFTGPLERIGRGLWHAFAQAYGLVGFFGLVVAEIAATVAHPRKLRVTALVHQMEGPG